MSLAEFTRSILGTADVLKATTPAATAGDHIARRGFIALSIEITDDDIDGFLAMVDRWCVAAPALADGA